MKNVDVVCPVYREAASIEFFHNALKAAVAPLDREIKFNFIYVVDPSPDRSVEILQQIADMEPNVMVLVMSRRFGHQAALIAGMDVSKGDAMITLDSDMQHPPELIPELISQWLGGADIVQALRRDNLGGDNLKAATSRNFYKLFERLTKMGIKPGAADYRLLSRKLVVLFREEMQEQNPFLRGLVTWVGHKIVYVPFTPAPRKGGLSNYSMSTLLLFAANGICSFSKLPLRACIWFGISFAALSVLGGIANLIIYFTHSTYQPGWASLFAFLTFGFGVNLFFLGVLGEYIGLIFDEVKNRPRYILEHIHGRQPLTSPHQQSEEAA